jgi:hypothetical protein
MYALTCAARERPARSMLGSPDTEVFMSQKPEDVEARRAAGTRPGDTATFEHVQGSQPADSRRTLEKMPHERDESASETGNRLDEAQPPNAREIQQAHDDVEQGMQDTDRRGVPDDVPSSRDNRGG